MRCHPDSVASLKMPETNQLANSASSIRHPRDAKQVPKIRSISRSEPGFLCGTQKISLSFAKLS